MASIAMDRLQKVHQLLLEMGDSYDKFLDLIEREHELIAAANIAELEKLVSQKVILSEQIESTVRELRSQYRQSYTIADSEQQVSEPTLTQIIDRIERLVLSQPGGSQRSIEIEKISSCRKIAKNLIDCRVKNFDRINVNKLVLQRMLNIHQENYRFWQKVADESESVYDASGGRKVESSRSILKVQV